MTKVFERWAAAAGVRALKTAAQAAIGAIGAATFVGAVDWSLIGGTALLAAILSLLTSVAGIPEIEDGASVFQLADDEEIHGAHAKKDDE